MTNKKYNLGLVSISFRNLSPEEILQAAKNVNLSCIEWGSDVHAPKDDKNKLTEIAELQKKHGITCSSYGTYFRIGVNPAEELEEYIDAAKILETDILRLWCYNKARLNMTQKEHDFLMNECEKVAGIAEKNNITVCLECHRDTYTEKRGDTVFLMEKINSPHFRMYWQPFQWQSHEENIQNAKSIAPYAHHIHVFNWHGSERFPLEDAKDEWREYMRCFSLPRTLLLEFMPNNSIGELETETYALRNIIGGVK